MTTSPLTMWYSHWNISGSAELAATGTSPTHARCQLMRLNL